MKLSLRASLALWQRRLTYRTRKLEFYRHKSKRPTAERKRLVVHWSNLVSEARTNVARRQKQIAAKTPLRVRAWQHAGELVGVMEQGGNNQGAKVTAIIRANGGTGPEPWCGDFVAYCYRLAGSLVVQRGWAAVRLLGFLTGMKVTADPLEGDIVAYTFDHTGLFGHWCDSAGRKVPKAQATHILTREGNTGASGAVSDSSTGGDGVYEKVRSRSLVARFVHVSR